MSDYKLSLEYRLSQLQQVAADPRAERMLAAPPARRGLSWLRTAIGEALPQVESPLVASQSHPSAQAR